MRAACRKLAHTSSPVAQNNRGYVADLQIVDEAAFVKDSLLLQCVLPVGLNAHVTTLMASTPGPAESWFMQAIKLLKPDSDVPVMPIIRAFAPCDMHAKSKNPQACMCKLDQRASWKNKTRERNWEGFWFSQKDTFIAENLGLQMADGAQVFHPDTVQRLRDRQRFHVTSPPAFIYITIDPAEGGKDKFAIVAHTDVGSHKWVVSQARRLASSMACASRSCGLIFLGTRSLCMRPSRRAMSTSLRSTTCASAKRNMMACQ